MLILRRVLFNANPKPANAEIPDLLGRLGHVCNKQPSNLASVVTDLQNAVLPAPFIAKALLSLAHVPAEFSEATAAIEKKLKQDLVPLVKTLNSEDLQSLVYAEMRGSAPNRPYVKFLLNELLSRKEFPIIFPLVHCLLSAGDLAEYISVFLGKARVENSRNFRELGEILLVLPECRPQFTSAINRTLKMKISTKPENLMQIIQIFALADVLALSTVEAFVAKLPGLPVSPWDLRFLLWTLERSGNFARLAPEAQAILKPKGAGNPKVKLDTKFLGLVEPPNSGIGQKLRRELKGNKDFRLVTAGPFILLNACPEKKVAVIPGEKNWAQPALRKIRAERNAWLGEKGWRLVEWEIGMALEI